MTDPSQSISLDIYRKLQDPEYRRSYFLAESSGLIARQLIALRKKRGLNQSQVAELVDTGQPAISRVERADYQNWSFNTLRKIAEALDARLRVYIVPAEDVLDEYREQDTAVNKLASAALDATETSPQKEAGSQKSLFGFGRERPTAASVAHHVGAQRNMTNLESVLKSRTNAIA